MSQSGRTPDFLIIGGGIIGLCVARELRRRFPTESILMIEKEGRPGMHASGRNSGVLHAGFYYTADSLKARYCRDGNLAMRSYIKEKKLPLNECGKLVVTRGAEDLPQLDELLRRGKANGVELEAVTAEEARKIEPRAITFERAIWSPTTATANPGQVIMAMRDDAVAEGIQFSPDCRYVGRTGTTVNTTSGPLTPGYVVNCAGAYADQVARDFGFSKDRRILPFKGLYLYSDEPPGSMRTNIYPVPDLRNPFLGVHFTVTTDGHAKIGPTALPALWREQYVGLQGFRAAEFFSGLWQLSMLFLHAGFDFRSLALGELRKCSRAELVKQSQALATGVDLRNYTRWGPPGIRAQLINTRTRTLEMDFVLEGDSKSFHVLNAVSPAWTCSIPFAAHVCDGIEGAVARKA
jgi:L-2-hydroxyglutarate oxidase LhgO